MYFLPTKLSLNVLLRESSKEKMFTAGNAGGMYSILLINFGTGGVKSTCRVLQLRQRWTQQKRNFAESDIVLLKDTNTFTNKWPMARVLVGDRNNNGQVRSVTVQSATGSMLDQPVKKLVLLLESPDERPGIPNEEAKELFSE